jgi:hypothetical protein
MGIETGVFRPAAIFFLPPSGQGDQHHGLAPGLLADAAGGVIAVQLR